MALGKRKPVQQRLFITTASLNVRSHPFDDAVNRVLDAHHFDAFVVPTGGASKVSAANDCCAHAARSWNAPSPTATRPAG